MKIDALLLYRLGIRLKVCLLKLAKKNQGKVFL